MTGSRWLWCGLAMLCVAITAAASPGGYPAPVQVTKLPNGLHVALAPDSMSATVDVALWFPAGSRLERTGHTGLTHLFDGLIFAGTPTHPSGEQQRVVQSEGGTLGAVSAADYARVENNVAPGSLEMALRFEADRMAHLAVNAQTFEAARGALRTERDRSAARGDVGQGLRRLYAVAFAGHPYRWPAEGIDTDVDHLTLLESQAWWRDHYGPEGTWLVLTGRFDPDSASALIRRTLGSVPRRIATRTEPAPPAEATAERRGSGSVSSPIQVLVVGWRTPSARAEQAASLRAIDHWLTHRKPSRLERTLVTDSTDCLAVNAGLDLRRDAGMFYVAVAVRPGADSAKVEATVIHAIESLTFTADDARSAARQFEVETLFGWQSSQGLGHAIGEAAVVEGDVNAAERELARVRALTAAELSETSRSVFNAKHRVVVWMNNKPEPPAPTAAPPKTPKTTKTTKKPATPAKGGR
jgi:zinc protease